MTANHKILDKRKRRKAYIKRLKKRLKELEQQ